MNKFSFFLDFSFLSFDLFLILLFVKVSANKNMFYCLEAHDFSFWH